MLTMTSRETAVEAMRPTWEQFPWLGFAYQELRARVARIGAQTTAAKPAGANDTAAHKRNNPRIIAYFDATTLHTDSEDTSWCSAFVNWCMLSGGVTGSRSALARSWLAWNGRAVRTFAQPPPGCIAVFERPPSATSGHVAFVWRVRADGSLEVLGGNQGGVAANSANHVAATASHVSISHRRDKPLGLIWPRGWDLPDPYRSVAALACISKVIPKDLVPNDFNS